MGYNSIMNCTDIITEHSVKKLNEMYQEYSGCTPRRGLLNNDISIMEYEFANDAEDDDIAGAHIAVWPKQLGDWSKNYNTMELAIFISRVCTNEVNLWFLGEEGERWGYIIHPGRVYDENVTVERGEVIYEEGEGG